jgi:hypothetical protein
MFSEEGPFGEWWRRRRARQLVPDSIVVAAAQHLLDELITRCAVTGTDDENPLHFMRNDDAMWLAKEHPHAPYHLVLQTLSAAALIEGLPSYPDGEPRDTEL